MQPVGSCCQPLATNGVESPQPLEEFCSLAWFRWDLLLHKAGWYFWDMGCCAFLFWCFGVVAQLLHRFVWYSMGGGKLWAGCLRHDRRKPVVSSFGGGFRWQNSCPLGGCFMLRVGGILLFSSSYESAKKSAFFIKNRLHFCMEKRIITKVFKKFP